MDFTLFAKDLGIAPGVPTMKGAYGNPENTGIGYNTIITELGRVSVNKYAHENYTIGRKPPGIDPKDGFVNIKRPIAQSTGQEDKRFHKFDPMPVRGSARTVGAIALLDVTIMALDTYMTYASFWDSEALQKQRGALVSSVNMVNSHMGLIPQKYREDSDKLGAIVNYVFQGENATKDQNVTKIGQQILKKVGRYDNETKKYKPFIEK